MTYTVYAGLMVWERSMHWLVPVPHRDQQILLLSVLNDSLS